MLALLLGTLLTRATTRRLDRIVSAAGRVGAGDLTVRVEDHHRDEIGDLSREFNSMVQDLRDSHDRVAYLQRVSAWQEIARRLAHEIKNPLTPILLAMQQLDTKFEQYLGRPERFRPLLKEALEIVQEEVGTLRSLVREFSQFGRLPQVTPEAVGVAGFVEDFVKTNPQLTQQAAIRVVVQPLAQKSRVELDAVLMRRALVNVIQNAIDAANEKHGGEPGAIAIDLSLSRDDDRLIVAVEDNGPGIEPQRLARVFEPYFTTKQTGTGLGLPIVKKIVLDHGGWVTLENREESEGCRLVMSFPVAEERFART